MQIVGYETAIREDGPALLLAADGTVTRQPLTPGTRLSYRLTDRRCAGTITEDGHQSCQNPSAPWCPQHTEYWPCAVCTGECTKPLPNCEKPHALYLAAFAPDLFKVGVTKRTRLVDRLREQGADRAAHLQNFPDGRLARQREADLATEIGDRIRVEQKIPGLHRSVSTRAWNDQLARFDPIDTFEFNYGLSLTHAAIPETTALGEVHGTKGRVLLLTVDHTTYAVDLRDLVGYEVVPAEQSPATDVDRQASLNRFS